MKITNILAIAFLMICFSCKNSKENIGNQLKSGYKYEHLIKTGGALPQKSEVVTLDFQIYTEDNVLDTDSRDVHVRPTLQIPAVVTPEIENNPLISLIMLMAKGDSALVYVPVDSLENPKKEFLDSKEVKYCVKILDIESEVDHMDRIGNERKAAKAHAENTAISNLADYKSGKLDGKLIEVEGGMKVFLPNDSQANKPMDGDVISVNYFGILEDETMFDNSYRAGRPYTFKLGAGSVIRGWDVGLKEVPLNEEAFLIIPSAMAYGERGSGQIKPNSDLYFWVKMENITNQ